MYNIRRIGCDGKHDTSFNINRPNGWDCYLLLFIKSNAYFTFNETEQLVEPYTFILFNKNSAHHYRAANELFINDWLQFECDDSIVLTSIPFNTPFYIGNMVDIKSYFRVIADCFYSEKNSKHLTCSLLVQAMLLNVSDIIRSEKGTNLHYSELIDLRKQIYAHPEYKWIILEIAENLFISSSHFQELYKKTFGISCGSDIIQSRIETAKNLLVDTNLLIKEIAEICGYNSDVHFSRQFKKIIGVSPQIYRKSDMLV